MSIITSNYRSDKIIVYTRDTEFELYSYKIVNKLKRKIKNIIDMKKDNFTHNMIIEYNKDIKKKKLFLEKFKQKG